MAMPQCLHLSPGILSHPMDRSAPLAGIILAAGKGTRMKSALPKVLHPLCGLPMLGHVVRAMRGAGVARPVIVVHPEAAHQVSETLDDALVAYVEQAEQRGTGHATLMARDALRGLLGPVLVAPGDSPLLSSEALDRLARQHAEAEAHVTFATFRVTGAHEYGRLVRDARGRPQAIVEHKDATLEQRAIDEVNAAVYVFDLETLWRLLPHVGTANASGEMYLTDVLSAIVANGGRAEAVCFDEPALFHGCNDRWELAEASRRMQERIQRTLARTGVTIVDPTTTWIGAEVEIEPDALIEPFSVLQGRTRVGAGSRIGPHATLSDAWIGRECQVLQSHVNGARLEDGAKCGPFAHLRPRTELGAGARVGNFVEVKNATLGVEARANHLAYIGDATVGARANVGAGTITCNYDGYEKHRTEIGEGAFIGSNSTLVAPVAIGAGAFVAAGSTITHDVPEDALAVGRARQEVKEQWACQWRMRKQGATRSA